MFLTNLVWLPKKWGSRVWDVKASPDFWRTAIPLKPKYTHEQFAFVIRSIREVICELVQKGEVEEAG